MMVSAPEELAPWQIKVAAKVAQQAACIPPKYTVPRQQLPLPDVTNVAGFAAQSGKMTAKELEITDLDDVKLLADRIKRKEYSAYEVAVAFCMRATLAQQVVNCLTEIFFDRALARAKELDDILANTGSVVGPLHGVPVSLKDQADIVGIETTIGTVSWIGNIPKTNAVIVDALLEQGAVLYCKTQIPLSLMLAHSKNNIFGRSLNPFNRSLSSGGSSGGEGSLIGFKGSPLGVGTDIAGSIRIPSYCCGLYGFKPSAGRMPYLGLAALAQGNEGILPAAGPLSRSMAGIDLLMSSVLASEPWKKDPHVVPMPWRPVQLPKKCTFAIIKHDNVFTPHPPIQRALLEVEQKLKSAGHEVIAMDVGDLWMSGMMLCWEILGASGGLAVVDACAASGEPLYPEILTGPLKTTVESCSDFFGTIRKRNVFEKTYADFVAKLAARTETGRIDAVLSPVAGHVAPPVDVYTSPTYHVIWNLLDFPAGVIPVSTVDPVKDAITSEWTASKASNPLDEQHMKLYDPVLFQDAPVCIQVASQGRLQEETCVAAMELISKLLV